MASSVFSLFSHDLLDYKQAAAYAGVSPSTIRQWVHRGLLEAAIPGEGRKIVTMYAKPDIDEAKRMLAEREPEGARAA
ncbi:helix-turn-helix domain-containing protein [Streptomyces sp. NPDC127051]|uniref:helix-turn-helix domain-containing protein n=1 Tax=Streptomyces sp. NPDC127051 TaxID=3347119 RepID=UPI0036599B2B